jgi:prepilin-type N-terminal cleavage/methylation domain-containing protein
MNRGDSGFTAVELIVVIIVVGIAAAVTVPAFLRGARNDRLAICESRLKSLWSLESTRRAKGLPVPGAKGREYWSKLVEGDAKQAEWLSCPLSPRLPYRGPPTDPAVLQPLAPVGADAPGSHGHDEGGNILLKTGEVRACRERDDLWKAAADFLVP